MPLLRLEVHHLRNITEALIEPATSLNIIYGENGSGKTSLLEAIYLLGLGRSFRSRNINHVVQIEAQALTVFGLLKNEHELTIPLGLERGKDGTIQIRIQEQSVHSSAELAQHLPLQLINQDSYQLLTGSPKFRRQFIDWALFHVEHNFYSAWKRFQRSLQQRNAALRSKVSPLEMQQWDKELVEAADVLNELRQQFFVQYMPIFKQVLAELTELNNIELIYRRGWSMEHSLAEALIASRNRDLQFGFTHDGPHRADMDIKLDKLAASQVLSRGQQKILTYSLLLAQGLLLNNLTERRCLYLIDDIAAELDQRHITAVLSFLQTIQAQVFITCINPAEIKLISGASKMFHVEQGIITFV